VSSLASNPVTIRPYRARDREGVRQVMADTAFFGDPVEVFLEDRDLFCDAFCAYYTDLEPEMAWVAEVGERVAGTLLGCAHTGRMRARWRRQVLPPVVKRWLQGRYRAGPLTWRYALAQLLAALRGEHPQAGLDPYPAHLHINVERGWRGRGLGKGLLLAYLDQLRELGIPGVHLSTTSLNRAAVSLYERVGFRLLDSRPTRAWRYWTEAPVENRLYGLEL
jgi:ribosomal protein S18 acetylase RimI-like enzyme